MKQIVLILLATLQINTYSAVEGLERHFMNSLLDFRSYDEFTFNQVQPTFERYRSYDCEKQDLYPDNTIGCKNKPFLNEVLSLDYIHYLREHTNRNIKLYKLAEGYHMVGLCNKENNIVFSNDINYLVNELRLICDQKPVVETTILSEEDFSRRLVFEIDAQANSDAERYLSTIKENQVGVNLNDLAEEHQFIDLTRNYTLLKIMQMLTSNNKCNIKYIQNLQSLLLSNKQRYLPNTKIGRYIQHFNKNFKMIKLTLMMMCRSKEK